ncbi:response regulator [Paenibacillaceae bacterium]|nr:response regulator [Paenibacillaceae bacterium]
MRKVMIVDDETLVRVGLQSMIDWESRGFKLAGVYKNGEEALQAAQKEHFDVILTDLSMPVMDGFQLITELKRIGCQANIVVLSSYNDFEHTRKAIQLGVRDYISKYELEPDEMIRVLESLTYMPHQEVSVVHHKRQENGDEERQRSAASEEVGEQGVAEQGEGVVAWAALRPIKRSRDYLDSEQTAMRLMVEDVCNRLKSIAIAGWEEDVMHALVRLSGSEWDEGDEALQIARAMLEEVQTTLRNNLNIPMVVSLSRFIAGKQDPQRLKQEALELLAVGSKRGPGVYIAQDTMITDGRQSLGNPDAALTEEWLDYYKHIRKLVQYQQLPELALWYSELADQQGRNASLEVQHRLGGLIASQLTDYAVEHLQLDAERLQKQFGTMWPLTEAVKRTGNLEQLNQLIGEMIGLAREAALFAQANHGWLLKVKAHVEAHFASPIPLEDMAELVHFSENYFSQRFRQETGESFTDYLTRTRIYKAVELYRETDLSTEEIALRCGYANANYFTKVFKKVTGQTISAFKLRT